MLKVVQINLEDIKMAAIIWNWGSEHSVDLGTLTSELEES